MKNENIDFNVDNKLNQLKDIACQLSRDELSMLKTQTLAPNTNKETNAPQNLKDWFSTSGLANKFSLDERSFLETDTHERIILRHKNPNFSYPITLVELNKTTQTYHVKSAKETGITDLFDNKYINFSTSHLAEIEPYLTSVETHSEALLIQQNLIQNAITQKLASTPYEYSIIKNNQLEYEHPDIFCQNIVIGGQAVAQLVYDAHKNTYTSRLKKDDGRYQEYKRKGGLNENFVFITNKITNHALQEKVETAKTTLDEYTELLELGKKLGEEPDSFADQMAARSKLFELMTKGETKLVFDSKTMGSHFVIPSVKISVETGVRYEINILKIFDLQISTDATLRDVKTQTLPNLRSVLEKASQQNKDVTQTELLSVPFVQKANKQ